MTDDYDDTTPPDADVIEAAPMQQRPTDADYRFCCLQIAMARRGLDQKQVALLANDLSAVVLEPEDIVTRGRRLSIAQMLAGRWPAVSNDAYIKMVQSFCEGVVEDAPRFKAPEIVFVRPVGVLSK